MINIHTLIYVYKQKQPTTHTRKTKQKQHDSKQNKSTNIGRCV